MFSASFIGCKIPYMPVYIISIGYSCLSLFAGVDKGCDLPKHHQRNIALIGVFLMQIFRAEKDYSGQFRVHYFMTVTNEMQYYDLVVILARWSKLEVTCDAVRVCLEMKMGLHANYAMHGMYLVHPSIGELEISSIL